MRRALVEAGVLDEVFHALGRHVAAVVEIEVVQVGVVLVGPGAGVGRAARIVFPRSTLRGRRRRNIHQLQPRETPGHSRSVTHLLVELPLGAWLCFVVFAVHAHVEFVLTERDTNQGEH